MNLTESFLTAFDSLLSNKLRAVLTMLGVIIGVAAVIALLSIGNGVQASITSEIQSFGSNLISISTDGENSGGYPALSIGDMEALADPLNAPALLQVGGQVQGNQEVAYDGTSKRTTVSGVTANYLSINNLEMGIGSGFTEDDLASKARVAVIGVGVMTDFFGEDEFPIGESLKINGVSYEVIGVLQEQGGFGGSDNNVFIPLTTAQARLYTARTRTGERAVDSIAVQAVSEAQTDAAIAQIQEILRERHNIAYNDEDDFETFSQTELLDAVSTVTGLLTLFLGSIAGISLLVGGIGIMNIMLVSVTERTREIGIRKAVGALRRDIMAQFIIESLVMSSIGGLIGIGLGIAISQLVAQLSPDFTPVVDVATVAMASGFAAGVGLVFGIYPAWRAAQLRPIEALRYE